LKNTPNSFSKNERQQKRARFLELTEIGTRISDDLFIIVYQKNDKGSRLGITVTRKIGNAVVRNQIKRYVRETFRLFPQRHFLKAEMNVIAKTTAATASFQEVNVALQNLFTRIANK